MLQVSEKITVLYPGDQLPVVTNDAIKVYLGGTMDFGSSENDWQTKFVEGLTKLTDPLKGLLMIKGANWIIFNPHVPPTNRLAPTLENPEFIAIMQWRMAMMDVADFVFLNIMNKSVSPMVNVGITLIPHSCQYLPHHLFLYRLYICNALGISA